MNSNDNMKRTPRTLVVLPARGGSKGIPGKNIKPLAGKPLIYYAIDHARAIASDADICVSTDSDDIIAAVEAYGLSVPFRRPAELAQDNTPTYPVLLHALDYYKSKGVDYDRLVLLQTTSPLVNSDDVRNALALHTPDIDMVVSVAEADTNPYYSAFETDENGFLHISKGDGLYTRRQDAPEVWQYNGAIYVITVSSLRKHSSLGAFARRIPYVMPRERSIDLDTPTDWLIAETLLGDMAKE